MDANPIVVRIVEFPLGLEFLRNGFSDFFLDTCRCPSNTEYIPGLEKYLSTFWRPHFSDVLRRLRTSACRLLSPQCACPLDIIAKAEFRQACCARIPCILRFHRRNRLSSPKTTCLRCSSICEAAGRKTLRFERIKEIKESFSLGNICIMAKQKALTISNYSNNHLQFRLYLECERLHFHVTFFVLFWLKHHL